MPGPPPKPTQLRLVTGNAGRRPLNKREPQPKAGIPSVPKHLSPAAKMEWRRISRALAALDLLTGVDRAALAAYCQAWADWIEAEAQLSKFGKVVESPYKTETRTLKSGTVVEKSSGGYPMQNPYLAIRNRALWFMHRFLTEFGMTPASRSRISVGDGGEKNRSKDPAAAYF